MNALEQEYRRLNLIARQANDNMLQAWGQYKVLAAKLNDPAQWSIVAISDNLAKARATFELYMDLRNKLYDAREQVNLHKKLMDIEEFGCVVGDVARYDCSHDSCKHGDCSLCED